VTPSGKADISARDIRNYMRKTARRVWCGGCGNGIAMGALIRAIIQLKIPQDQIAVFTGIGCNGRGAAYIEFDSMQTPHGRPIPVATGLKLTRPEMEVIVYSGDGDIAAIGGNHLIHAARRNIGITVVLVNNFIYGMTGGQVAPTTPHQGLATTAPYGNLEYPFDICTLAAAAGATYVARGTTYHVNQLASFIAKGIQNKGFSLIEVISQCPTQFGKLNNRGTPAQMLLWLKRNSISLKEASSKTPQELEGKVVIGEFVEKERPELAAQYRRMLETVKKEGLSHEI
jgi:2-oxoglutarate ferredoxin oxidoreductase subunit beta